MKTISLKLKIWRQAGRKQAGKLVDYFLENISTDMSFLEMLDVLNENLMKQGIDPIAFDSDCREGICGTCGIVIQGIAHGPRRKTTTCQLHLREFKDGETIIVEPFRAESFEVIKDLVVDRQALDKIIQKGGYTSCDVGGAPDGNAILIAKKEADDALSAAACIGCGACVASCPNASASLFVGAKVSQYTHLPQGIPERKERVLKMVEEMDKQGFGACSNHGECSAVCPQGISITHIAKMRREFIKATLS